MAGSGKFSSDRTIAEYAAEIWNVETVSGDKAKKAAGKLSHPRSQLDQIKSNV